jgi:hypothetical protein
MKLVRRASLFVFAFLLLQQAAYAQEGPAAAVFVGANQSYFATSPTNETNAGTGVLVGAFVLMRRDKFLQIQPELQFQQRSSEVLFGSSFSEFSTNYVNVGLMTRLKLFKGLYTTQGAQFWFPVRAKLGLGGKDVDIKDNIASDFSIPAGVGRQFGRIGIEGRWDAGLKRVEKAPLGNTTKRNRTIEIFAIIGF